MTFIVGIDPGTKGGVAVLTDTGVVILAQAFTPGMLASDFTALIKLATNRQPLKGVFLEKVGHIKGDGARGSFTFGRAGAVDLLLLGLGIKPRYVPPAFWQARLECLSGGNKASTKARAKALFGSQVKVTHGNADALLIAEYGRRCLS